MKKYFYILSALLAMAVVVDAADHKSSESGNSYMFMSGKISAQMNDTFLPVKAFDGKRFHVSGSDSTIRPAKDISCAMKPVMVISNLYADVNELEYNFDSNADRLRSMWALNEMESEQMRFQAGVEFENMRGGRPQGTTERDVAATALNDLTKDQVEEDIRKTGISNWVDNIRGKYSVVPNRSIENAYSALVLSFVLYGEDESKDIKRSIVRIVPVGDLQAGENKNLKFNCTFPELKISTGKLDIFLFDGKGKYVATNLSRGLKEITPEHLQRLRELEKQNKAKKAAENS